jgi:ABC-type bacteriocin/lantibiotic exporter with double-glycine peptidase domain
MRLIKQRGMNDCGIACAAMICQSTYKQAEWAFKAIWRDKDKGLNTRQMCDGIRDLGPMYPVHSYRLMRWNYDAVVGMLVRGHVALLKVVDHNAHRPHHDFHWCVFNPDNGYIYDPLGQIMRDWQIRQVTLIGLEATHYVEFR